MVHNLCTAYMYFLLKFGDIINIKLQFGLVETTNSHSLDKSMTLSILIKYILRNCLEITGFLNILHGDYMDICNGPISKNYP